MHSDVVFITGSQHKICQDYARANRNIDNPYVIISDGCSSAPNTDFGSRLLVNSADSVLSLDNSNAESVLETIAIKSFLYTKILELHPDSLCATLIYLKIEGNAYKSVMCGDGVIAGKRHNGSFFLKEYAFDSNAPYYLRYSETESMKKDFSEKCGLDMTVTTWDIDDNNMETTIKKTQFDLDHPYQIDVFPIEEYEFAAIFSDGLSSFRKWDSAETYKQQIPIDVPNVFMPLLSFKSWSGDFVHRRVNRALKELKNEGSMHLDDLSIGVIKKD